MKDFSLWKEYAGTSEGSGRREKIWLQDPETGQTGLFKFKKDTDTTDHVSECLAYQIAQLLELPCAKFELGCCYGREGSMSYNIIQNDSQILIEGIYFITSQYPEYDSEMFVDRVTGKKYSVEMVLQSIQKYVPIDNFLKMLIFDFLIGNTDRHQNNWAILEENGQMKWSPLYDNSSSLCAYIAQSQIQSYMGKDRKRWNALVDTKSRSMLRCCMNDEKRPTHLVVLEYVHDHYCEETIEFVKRITDVLTETSIYAMLNQYSITELSKEKKNLILKFLLSKIELMKQVYF